MHSMIARSACDVSPPLSSPNVINDVPLKVGVGAIVFRKGFESYKDAQTPNVCAMRVKCVCDVFQGFESYKDAQSPRDRRVLQDMQETQSSCGSQPILRVMQVV